jgi:hypothetical protein
MSRTAADFMAEAGAAFAASADAQRSGVPVLAIAAHIPTR